jgi:transposase
MVVAGFFCVAQFFRGLYTVIVFCAECIEPRAECRAVASQFERLRKRGSEIEISQMLSHSQITDFLRLARSGFETGSEPSLADTTFYGAPV